jgi:Tol biopolymer transport system component
VEVDGHYIIAFESTRDHYPDTKCDIYVVNPDTEEILCHFDTGVSETHPSFSPDGLSFAFSMQEEGEDDSELYIYCWKIDELYQLTDDDSYDNSPSWGWNWD